MGLCPCLLHYLHYDMVLLFVHVHLPFKIQTVLVTVVGSDLELILGRRVSAFHIIWTQKMLRKDQGRLMSFNCHYGSVLEHCQKVRFGHTMVI